MIQRHLKAVKTCTLSSGRPYSKQNAASPIRTAVVNHLASIDTVLLTSWHLLLKEETEVSDTMPQEDGGVSKTDKLPNKARGASLEAIPVLTSKRAGSLTPVTLSNIGPSRRRVQSAIRGSGISAALALTKQPHFYVNRKVASEVAEHIFSWQNSFLRKLANRH